MTNKFKPTFLISHVLFQQCCETVVYHFIFICLFVFSLAPSLQIGQVLAHPEHVDQDHWELRWCPGQPDLGAGHHCLHLCGGGDAALREELQGVRVQDQPGLRAATLAHARLLPLLSHRLPRAVRGVDRDHVGLHGGGWPGHVPHCLYDGHGHRQLGG